MMDRLRGLFRPPPSVAPIADPVESARLNRYWRKRILYSTMIGYAIFYFVRKNLSMAMPALNADLGITKDGLGLFLTLHGVMYGVSKFANGFLGDRTNPRVFMSLGLICAAYMNIGFGLSNAALALGVFWVLNGWFQGMGYPPCARSLSNWFAPTERGTWFAVWNTSNPFGSAVIFVLCGYLVAGQWRTWLPSQLADTLPANWRLCFLLPAVLALAGAIFLLNRLRDRPESLGLPPVTVPKKNLSQPTAEPDEIPFRRFVLHNVFLNPMIWIVSLANFFVYTIRYTVVDWGPMFLKEMKGVEILHSSRMVAAYELSGMVGILLSGWLMDRAHGKGGRVCLLWMLLCGACILAFWKLQTNSMFINTLLLCGTGFFVYGPQCLVGVLAANLASRRAAATAVGLTGLFGYLSTVLSGWIMGLLVERTKSWDIAFEILLASAAVAVVLFALMYNAGYHPDEVDSGPR
jgi:sugar phosphate permease